jgi:hypothetical protein
LLIKKTTIDGTRAETEKFFAFFSKIIWLFEKKAVPLHPLLKKVFKNLKKYSNRL